MLLKQGILQAAGGVDRGCGVSAYRTNLRRHEINEDASRRILGRIRDTVPSGVGRGHTKTSELANEFIKWRGWPSIDEKDRILAQFGTLGSGNHFA